MGKNTSQVLKRFGFETRPSSSPSFFRSKLQTPAQKEAQLKAYKEQERQYQLFMVERQKRIDTELELIRIQKEAYDRPLSEFPQLIPNQIRLTILLYVRRVVSDSCKNRLLFTMEHPEQFGEKEVEAARQELVSFKDIPLRDFKVAVRVSNERTILFFSCNTHFWPDSAVRRIQKNLPKNIPVTEEILGTGLSVHYWISDDGFAKLKKSGFKYSLGEVVKHLEIF